MDNEHHINEASDALFSHAKLPVEGARFTTAAGLLMIALVSAAIVLTQGVPGNTPSVTAGAVSSATAPAQAAKAG